MAQKGHTCKLKMLLQTKIGLSPGATENDKSKIYLDEYDLYPGGGGGTPQYGLYRYVRPQRVGFFSRFGHKLGIDFGYFAAILVINRVTIFAL